MPTVDPVDAPPTQSTRSTPTAPRPRRATLSLREPTAKRMVRWRIRLLLFSLAEIAIAQLIVFVVLPPQARVFSFEVV